MALPAALAAPQSAHGTQVEDGDSSSYRCAIDAGSSNRSSGEAHAPRAASRVGVTILAAEQTATARSCPMLPAGNTLRLPAESVAAARPEDALNHDENYDDEVLLVHFTSSSPAASQRATSSSHRSKHVASSDRGAAPGMTSNGTLASAAAVSDDEQYDPLDDLPLRVQHNTYDHSHGEARAWHPMLP